MMPFTTRKALREAIDNVDRAIQRAVNDGNLVDVFEQFKRELVSGIWHHHQCLG
jgi:hypothetical protein